MTALTPRSYRFRTPAQWSSCVLDRVDQPAVSVATIRPIAPFEQSAHVYGTHGAHAPVATRAAEILWRDDAGRLYRLTTCDDEPCAGSAPHVIGKARRLVSASRGLWVIDESGEVLHRFDEESLSHLAAVSFAERAGLATARIVDVTSDGYDLLFALVEHDGIVEVVRFDCAGRMVARATLDGAAQARAFVFLRRVKRFAVLTGGSDPHLLWFAEDGGTALTRLRVAAMRPCFRASALGSDAKNLVLLAGTDGASPDNEPFLLTFDGDGASLGELALDAPASGVTATRDSLLVTDRRGLKRYPIASTVPDGTAEVRCSVITPVLHSPEREDRRRWLRIEATASLPAGAALEISYAVTPDAAVRDRLDAIAADRSMPAGHRARKLFEAGHWSTPLAFHGSPVHAGETGSAPGEAPSVLSAPLFDVREPYVWVCVTLVATAGGSVPTLNELAVLYPGPTLMDNLPAIYRRFEAQPGDFLRSLVGVLESTTQGVDARIAALASQIHPATAAGPWLDFIARWLGLPWDDALGDEQKKRLVARASEIGRSRGTRTGIEAFLECLMPEMPRRFRVSDATADFGFATVGGHACRGSALPALLGGRTAWRTELDATTVLGRMRLPCPGQADDGVSHLTGLVRVEVAASAAERSAWEPWLAALLEDLVPLTARLRLDWVARSAVRGARLDGSLILEGPPLPHLGSDAVTGVARLPDRGSRITSTGAATGTRLQ